MLANQVDIDNREKLRLKKELQIQNIIPMDATQLDQTKKPNPLRKVQEDSEKLLKKRRKDGMVGELSKLFLQEKPPELTATEREEEEAGYEQAQGMWEGWENLEEAPEEEDEPDPQWVEEEEPPVVRPTRDEIILRQSTRGQSRQSASQKNSRIETTNKRGKQQKENIHPDDSFGDIQTDTKQNKRNLSPGDQGDNFELSSIVSDTSEYTPQRRQVHGDLVKNLGPAQQSKRDEAISFNDPSKNQGRGRRGNENETSFGNQDEMGHPAKQYKDNRSKDGDLADSLQIPRNTNQGGFNRPPSRPDSRRGSRENLGESGSQRELRRVDSGGDGFARSNKLSSGSGSKSVLQVKKRDKSDMMNNLARIHAQRVEDQEQNAVQEEDDDEGEPVGIDWEKRIQELKNGKKNKTYRIPGERMEERIKKRKVKTQEMDEWGVKSKPRMKNLDARNVSYRFKNKLEESEKKGAINVNIEMLHTDELMAYYRELIAKGNRDFAEHQRFQNQIKKLEYENTICTKSPKKQSLSPNRENKVIDRYMRENSPEAEKTPENRSTGAVILHLRSELPLPENGHQEKRASLKLQ